MLNFYTFVMVMQCQLGSYYIVKIYILILLKVSKYKLNKVVNL